MVSGFRFKSYCCILMVLVSAILFSGQLLAQEQKDTLTLEEAIKLSLEQGGASRLALFELQEAEVSYKQSMADLILRPSVTTELSVKAAWVTAQRDYEIARADIATQVEQAYYDVLKAERGLVLARENLTQAEDQLKVAESKFKLGMVAQIDVITADAEFASAEAEMSRAESNLALSRMRFNRLIGIALDSTKKLTSEFKYVPVSFDLEKAIRYALSNRPEIKRAEDTVALKKKEVEVYTNDFTPPLVLEKAKAGLSYAEAGLEDVKTGIALEVRQNLESFEDAKRQVPLQEKSLLRAKESLRIAKARYEAGVITAIELRDVQRAVYQAETAYLQAMFDYNVALTKFYKSLGISLERRAQAFEQLVQKGH